MNKFYLIIIVVILASSFFLFKIFNKTKLKGDAESIADSKVSKSSSDSNQNDSVISENNLEKDDPITKIKGDDKEIERFYDTAQKHLPYLIEFMKENGSDTTFYKYFLKVKFCEHGECEHMWVQAFSYKNEMFTGTLSNDPSIMKHKKFGDKLQVKKVEVEDWILIDDLLNVKVGGYSQDYIKKMGE